MSKTLIMMMLSTLFAACTQPQGGGEGQAGGSGGGGITMSSYGSDVYNQGKTEACWIYAMCACIEREAWTRGDSIVMSRQWLMSHLMEEQALERYEIRKSTSGGIKEGGRGTLSMRGVGADAIRLIEDYGMVPFLHERSRIGSSMVLQRKLALLADNAASRRLPRQDFEEKMRQMLPRFTVVRHRMLTHDLPDNGKESFYYLSMRYTPKQFAESVMYCQKWHWYASEEAHPWGENFALEVPDNRRYHRYENKPMPELLRMVRESLDRGHAVYWEYGFEPSRQKQGGGAASDHAMAIIGMDGKDFICLNSYGKDWGKDGCVTISEAFFLKHTCNVGIVSIGY